MPNTELYERLGVQPDADPAAIKRAHRRKAKALHPDIGGDADAFAAVQSAYDTLSDPEKRERYDRTGEVDGPDNQEAALLEEAGRIVAQVLNQDLAHGQDPAAHDFVEACRAVVRVRLSEIAQTVATLERQARTLARLSGRVTVRGEADRPGAGNRLRALVEGHAQEAQRRLGQIENARTFNRQLLAFLEGYAFEPDPAARASPTSGTPFARLTITLP